MYIDLERIKTPTNKQPSLTDGLVASFPMGNMVMMTTAARKELIEAANQLAYNYIKHSGMWRDLTNDQWDALAEKIAERMLGLMDGMVSEAANSTIEQEQEW